MAANPDANIRTIFSPQYEPIRATIARHLPPASYITASLTFGPRSDLRQSEYDRLYSPPCQAVLSTVPYLRCNQPAGTFPPVRVSRCEGSWHYLSTPILNAQNQVQVPPTSRVRHPIHPYYQCQNCFDRDDAARRVRIPHHTARYKANHCRTHSVRLPRNSGTHPASCVCYETVSSIAIGFTCVGCYGVNAWQPVLTRAQTRMNELLHTHRTLAKKGNGALRRGRRTKGVYVDGRRRKAPACPVRGCGRTAMRREGDEVLVKTCLACRGVYRANE